MTFAKRLDHRRRRCTQAPTFADIWLRYFTLKKPHWSKPQIGAVEPIMRRAILAQIGERDIATFTPEPLQAALNHMAEMPLLIGTRKETQYTRIGYGESALKTARTYIRAVFEFALDEDLIQRNPAKRLELPPTRKVCGRFLSMEEVRALIGAAAGRERLVLRLFLVAGLRPAELFALRPTISCQASYASTKPSRSARSRRPGAG